MTAPPRIGVTPPPLCSPCRVKDEINRLFPSAVFNETGKYFSEEELIRFGQGMDALVIGRDPVSERVLSSLPELKLVAKYGVGLDTLDQEALSRHKVELGWTPGVNCRSVAEMTLGFMLGLCHNVFWTADELKKGRWIKRGGRDLRGTVVGIVGCGHVGSEVVRLLQPFQCTVWVHDILDKSQFCRESGAEAVSWNRIVEEADIITLHVPLTELTDRMVEAKVLGRMKRTAFLINTSRGEVVDPEALKAALKNNELAGAALDVYVQEPVTDDELLALPNFMGTPHIGGNSVEAVDAMGQAALDHLIRYFKSGWRTIE